MPSQEKALKATKSKGKTADQKQSNKKSSPEVAFKSTEFIRESDDEGQRQSAETSSSGEDSDPEDSPKSSREIHGKLPAPNGSSSSSEGGSGSEEEESSEESEEESAPIPEPLKPTIIPRMASRQVPTSAASKHKPANTPAPSKYDPPSGFNLGKNVGAGSSSAELFSKSHLAGKQIWYFTAPASVPSSLIKQMSLKDAKEGNAILSHNGNEFGFFQDGAADTTHTKILIPDTVTGGYKASRQRVDQVLHLQRVVKLPGVTTTGLSTKATVPAAKPIRPQPKGLKMRFQAIGVSNTDVYEEDASDADMEEAPKFQKPANLVDSDVEMTESPVQTTTSTKMKKDKTSKKDRKDKSEASLKRKHSDGKEKKSKSSSYNSTIIGDRQLKRIKKKQNESQDSLGHRVPALTEPLRSSQVLPPPPTYSTTSKPSRSSPLAPRDPIESQHLGESSIPQPAKSSYETQAAPLRENRNFPSPKEHKEAKDLSLTGEEKRRKKSKTPRIDVYDDIV